MRKSELHHCESTNRRFGLLYVSVVVGAFLRVFHLGAQSIWGDEALTLQRYAAGESLAQVLSGVWHSAFHPPLYFVIVHYWCLLGKSEIMLRMPSAVFGIAAIPLIYLVARRIFGPPVPGLSALVLALAPFHVWYSQEARMYSLQVLLALGSMLFFLRAWESRRPMDFALYGILTVLALYTHIATLLLIAAQGVFVVGAAVRNWRRNLPWIGIVAVMLLAFTPWIVQFMGGRRSFTGIASIGFGREPSPLHLGYGLYTFSVGYSLGPSVSELHFLSSGDVIRRNLAVILASVLVFGALMILGLRNAHRKNRMGFWLILSHLCVPLGLAAAASLVTRVPLNPRYLMVAAIPYWIAIALGVDACVRSRALRVIPAAGVLLIAFSLYNHYFQPAYAKQDVRCAVALVNDKARPDDVVIISSIELGGPFTYYFKRQDVSYVGYPPGQGFVDPNALPRDMEQILHRKKRAWLILGRTWSSDPPGLIPAYFRARYELVEQEHFPGVALSCFSLLR
ncbi:MAG TPA: glycosyltransferase family 39 protein [Armatimonadota bacterium]|nr:glycosyltransferase family 39 protein [Armatimonadota bacterium]